jgi:hyperosmotically inducible protein
VLMTVVEHYQSLNHGLTDAETRELVRRLTSLGQWRKCMTAWNVVPVLALLTLAPAHLSARATPAPQTVVDQTKEGAEKTKDAVVKGTKTAVDKTKDGLSKTGEVITDAWITTRVHERFVGEDLLKDSDISVDSRNHVVTLKGTVMGRAGRLKAAQIAKDTEGVHRVVNQLTIGAKHKS